MARRIMIGNDGGTFRFRATLPGFDARTAPEGNAFQVHESMTPMAAAESGTVGITAGSFADITLANTYADPPFVLLNADDNRQMGETVSARFFISSNLLRIFNHTGVTKTVRWALLADFFA